VRASWFYSVTKKR